MEKILKIGMNIADWTTAPPFSTEVETIKYTLLNEINKLSIDLVAIKLFKNTALS